MDAEDGRIGRLVARRPNHRLHSHSSPASTTLTTDLWLMDADGTNERILVPEIPANHGVGPVWSPDGERIAYQRLCDPPDRGSHQTVPRRAAKPSSVTVNEDNPLEPAGTGVVIPPPQTSGPDRQPRWWYPYSVTWSPDGNVLLYHAWRAFGRSDHRGGFR